MTRRRPLPRVEIDLRPTLPGWAVRAAAALAVTCTPALAALTTPVMGGFAPTLVAVAVGLGLWTAWRPSHGPALTATVLVAFVLAFQDSRGLLASALWLAPLAYLALRLCRWAAECALTSRVEIGALARSARTDGLVIGVTLLIGAIALLVERNTVAGLLVGAIAALGLVLTVRATEDEDP